MNFHGSGNFNSVHDQTSYDLCVVVKLIQQLYFNPVDASKTSQSLSDFQTSRVAFDISILLLTYCSPDVNGSPLLVTFSNSLSKAQLDLIIDADSKSVVSFFAAETISTLCQLGYRGGNQQTFLLARQLYPNESGLCLVQRILKELIASYSTFSRQNTQTLYKLSQAASACFLFSFLDVVVSVSSNFQISLSEDAGRVLLSELIQSFTETPVLFFACLDILGCLPTDLSRNKKLALTADQRQTILSNLLHYMGDIFATVARIHEFVTCNSFSGEIEPNAYYIVARHWQLVESPTKPTLLCALHLIHLVKEVSWYDGIVRNSFNINRTKEIDYLRYFRSSILSCFLSWVEASVRSQQQHTEAQCSLPQREPAASLCDGTTQPYDVVVGSTLHDAQLLLQSDMLRILLMNFIFTVHTLFHQSESAQGEDTLPLEMSLELVAEMDSGHDISNEDGSLLHSITNILSELLELMFMMYSLHSHDTLALSNEESQNLHETCLLSLINWTNFEPLMCIFYTVAHLDTFIRCFCNGSTSLDFPLSLAKIAQLPGSFLHNYLNFLSKFAEVFLPALIYSVQNNTFNSQDFKIPPSFSQCETLDLFVSQEHFTEQKDFITKARSIFHTLLDLLQHPSLEIRHLVFEFWFALVGNQFIIQQAQLEMSQKDIFECTKSDRLTSLEYHTLHEPFLLSCFDSLVDRIIDLAAYPKNLKDLQNSFPFSAWIKFRDDCSVAFTDAVTVLCSESILEKAGKMLIEQLEFIKGDTSFDTCRKVETCLFMLTALAPRIQTTKDIYIPLALNALPTLPYQQSTCAETYVMVIAASKLMLWTTGFIGSNRELFATCFQLLKSLLPLFLTTYVKPKETERKMYSVKTELELFASYTERILIEAINCIATAASSTLAMDITVPESDVTFVLNGLAESVLLTQLTMESRCSLIVSAGALLQCLSISKMQKYHYHIAQALQTQVMAELSSTPCNKLTCKATEYLKLFFTALESVQPVEAVPSPPYSHNAVPLEAGSEFRHPVLNVVEEFWDLFEKCLLEFHHSETVIEAVSHCLTRIFSKYPSHAVRYTMFQRFLTCLAHSFLKSPTIFHLAALRSMVGIFGGNREEPVIRSVVECLLTCTKYVLHAIQRTDAHTFMSDSPDIVGMTLDCVNTALTLPPLACELLDLNPFYDVLLFCVALTPECPHPKVLMTMLLLLTRFVAWLNLPRLLESPPCTFFKVASGKVDKQMIFMKCSEKAKALCTRLDLVRKIVTSAIRVVTEIFHGNTQWIGIIATLLVELLHIPEYSTLTRETIQVTLQTGSRTPISSAVLSNFYDCLHAPKTLQTHPFMCRALQQLANHAEIQWQQNKFSQLTA